MPSDYLTPFCHFNSSGSYPIFIEKLLFTNGQVFMDTQYKFLLKVKEENGVDYMKMLTGDTDGLEEFTG